MEDNDTQLLVPLNLNIAKNKEDIPGIHRIIVRRKTQFV
jgi:hypothetical protein